MSRAKKLDALIGVPLQEYVDKILGEKDRALKMSDDEREKAAAALRGEQNRAEDRAAAEREKAAAELRDRITAGDNATRAEVTALAREVAISTRYSEKAIDKADRATELRFSGFNEFNDRINQLTQTFPTRELMDTHINGLAARLTALEGQRNKDEGIVQARQETRADTRWNTTNILQLIAVAAAAGAILYKLVTGH